MMYRELGPTVELPKVALDEIKTVHDILEKLIENVEMINDHLKRIDYKLQDLHNQLNRQEMDIAFLKSRTQSITAIGGRY